MVVLKKAEKIHMFSNLSLSASVLRSDKRFSCNKNYFRIIHTIKLLLEAYKARNADLRQIILSPTMQVK